MDKYELKQQQMEDNIRQREKMVLLSNRFLLLGDIERLGQYAQTFGLDEYELNQELEWDSWVYAEVIFEEQHYIFIHGFQRVPSGGFFTKHDDLVLECMVGEECDTQIINHPLLIWYNENTKGVCDFSSSFYHIGESDEESNEESIDV